MNPTQIVTIISISAITLCLIALTAWIISLLSNLKNTIIKTNLILDNAKLITDDIGAPISQIKDFFIGVKEGITLIQSFFHKNDK
mgnify:CR=1 FL=1